MEKIDSLNIIVLKVTKGYRLHQLLSSLLIAIERSEEEKRTVKTWLVSVVMSLRAEFCSDYYFHLLFFFSSLIPWGSKFSKRSCLKFFRIFSSDILEH